MHIIVTVTVKYLSITPSFHLLFFIKCKYEYTNEKIIVCYFSFSDGKMLISVLYIFIYLKIVNLCYILIIFIDDT